MAAPRRSQHHHHHHPPPPAPASPPRSPGLSPAGAAPSPQRHSLAGPEGEAPPSGGGRDAERALSPEQPESAAGAAPPPASGSSSSSVATSSGSASSSSSAASSPAAESPESPGPGAGSGAFRELLEACRNGDVTRVKRLVDTGNVNAKDMAGRKSTPLHFAAGERRRPAGEGGHCAGGALRGGGRPGPVRGTCPSIAAGQWGWGGG
uniref:Uncharacterized protein n=1 Tax=Chrysemys picta bellii TaxID=8478 RepID=A0A8C3HPQ0_CHRPI